MKWFKIVPSYTLFIISKLKCILFDCILYRIKHKQVWWTWLKIQAPVQQKSVHLNESHCTCVKGNYMNKVVTLLHMVMNCLRKPHCRGYRSNRRLLNMEFGVKDAACNGPLQLASTTRHHYPCHYQDLRFVIVTIQRTAKLDQSYQRSSEWQWTLLERKKWELARYTFTQAHFNMFAYPPGLTTNRCRFAKSREPQPEQLFPT